MFSENEIFEIFELIGNYDPDNPKDVQRLAALANSLGISKEQLSDMLKLDDVCQKLDQP